MTNELRCDCSLNWGTISAFAWTDWERPQKASVRIASLWAEIWTQNLKNMKECHTHVKLAIFFQMIYSGFLILKMAMWGESLEND
jgi:hypothetical protein